MSVAFVLSQGTVGFESLLAYFANEFLLSVNCSLVFFHLPWSDEKRVAFVALEVLLTNRDQSSILELELIEQLKVAKIVSTLEIVQKSP